VTEIGFCPPPTAKPRPRRRNPKNGEVARGERRRRLSRPDGMTCWWGGPRRTNDIPLPPHRSSEDFWFHVAAEFGLPRRGAGQKKKFVSEGLRTAAPGGPSKLAASLRPRYCRRRRRGRGGGPPSAAARRQQAARGINPGQSAGFLDRFKSVQVAPWRRKGTRRIRAALQDRRAAAARHLSRLIDAQGLGDASSDVAA